MHIELYNINAHYAQHVAVTPDHIRYFLYPYWYTTSVDACTAEKRPQ